MLKFTSHCNHVFHCVQRQFRDVTLKEVLEARDRISPHVHETPVLTCSTFDVLSGRQLFFKCENLQKTGSFKVRGATNAILKAKEEHDRMGKVVVYNVHSCSHWQIKAVIAQSSQLLLNLYCHTTRSCPASSPTAAGTTRRRWPGPPPPWPARPAPWWCPGGPARPSARPSGGTERTSSSASRRPLQRGSRWTGGRGGESRFIGTYSKLVPMCCCSAIKWETWMIGKARTSYRTVQTIRT